ncbi:hypothetical protein A143_16340 [Vibrio splendidus ZS-139]|nr:hypothetical protein A143_16340 [Vibrio splendidus ZS-139]
MINLRFTNFLPLILLLLTPITLATTSDFLDAEEFNHSQDTICESVVCNNPTTPLILPRTEAENEVEEHVSSYEPIDELEEYRVLSQKRIPKYCSDLNEMYGVRLKDCMHM